MNEILTKLFLKHKTWISYLKSMGCSSDIAEDFVQDMYIKIYNYSQKTNNDILYNGSEVNYYFIYVILKNDFYDSLRKNKKYKAIELTDDFLTSEIEYNETDFNLKSNKLQTWHSKLLKEIDALENYDKKKANLCYIKFIFDKVFVEQISISELSRTAKISYWSLRNISQIIKKNIADEIGR